MGNVATQERKTRRVSLRIRVPGAREIVLTGDFSEWSDTGVPMKSGAGDEWVATLSLAPGEYQYRLRVDGMWQNNPEAGRRVPNPFGSENDVLIIS